MSNHAIIKISRKQSVFNLLRPMTIFVNGKNIAAVNNNEIMNVKVLPGSHELMVALDSYKTPPLTVTMAAGDTVALVCGVKEGKAGLLAGLFNQEDYLYLKEEEVTEED